MKFEIKMLLENLFGKRKILSFLFPPLFLDFRPSPSSRVSPDQPPPGVLCRPSPAPAQRPLPRPSPPAVFSAWTCSPAPPLSSGGFGSSNREPKPPNRARRRVFAVGHGAWPPGATVLATPFSLSPRFDSSRPFSDLRPGLEVTLSCVIMLKSPSVSDE